jgi:hypothetical protein
MPEIPFNFLNRRSKTAGFRPTDLQDGQIYIQQADEAILFKNDSGPLVCVSARTGSFVTSGQTGTLSWSGHTHEQYVNTGSTGNFVTTSQTGVFVLAANTGSFVTTSQTGNFASLDGSNYLCSTQIPNITGDVCINAGSNVSTVYKIQGYPVANTQPTNGQTLQFNGSSWVPGDIAAGGNGGGGLVYYFNEAIAADLPTGSLPTSYSGTYELGRTGMFNQKSFQTPTLPQATYSGVVGFISDVLDPQTTSIPAGLFDFNIWASSNTATQTVLKLEVYKYDGATTTASLLASSDDVYTYDGTVTAQYILSVVLPQTTISSTDRLYIRILAKALATNKNITLYFGGNTPSHVHTTIPAVGGSGLIKVINGIMQSSASALVDADVSASAAIAGTKIQTNYFALASATGSFVTTSQTGILSWSGHTHAQYVNTGSTGVFALAANTGSFVTTAQTGTLSWSGHTHAQYVSTGSTGVFALAANTGSFVTTAQTGNFVSAGSTGSFVTTAQTGNLVSVTQTGNFLSTGAGSVILSAIEENITICSSVGASGLINFDTISSSSMYYTPNSTANFYLNLRGNSSCSFNSFVDVNKTLTATFLNTNGSTAYALTGISIDGTGRTIKWLNGTGSYPAGNTGSIDSYSITAVKTGNNLYTVFGSQGKFV